MTVRSTLLLLVSFTLSACDCVDVGFPAADIAAVDAITGAPVSLGGAEVTYTVEGILRSTEMVPPGMSEYNICCITGEVDLRVRIPGYAPTDTSFRIYASGDCDRAIRRRVVLRLQRGG